MFVTEELNAIAQIFKNRHPSKDIKQQLLKEYVNLEATLLRAKVLRDFSLTKVNYIVQAAIPENDINLAYLFAPFILSNLNQPVIYTTPVSKPVLMILKNYYQAEHKVHFKIENILDSLKLYIDLDHSELNEEDFLFKRIIQAICRTDVSHLFLITALDFDLQLIKHLEDFVKIRIHVIQPTKNTPLLQDEPLNTSKLLFKHKDEFHHDVCEYFSEMNANLISVIDTFTHQQGSHMIDDMFYSEHIFEKLSVYSEYIQTRIQG